MSPRALLLLLGMLLAPVACQPAPRSERPPEAGPPDGPAEISPDLLRVPAQKLSRVEIAKRMRDASERRVVLEKGPQGWMLTSPVAYPANRTAVDSIVAMLAEVEIVASAPADPRMARRAQLTPDASIEVAAWAGDKLASHFLVGSSGIEETHMQRVGDSRILTVRGRCRPLLDKGVDALRHPVITDLEVTRIERATYTSTSGTLVLVADPATPGMFLHEGRAIRNFDQARASKGVAVIAGLLAKGFVDTPFDRKSTGLFDEATPRATLVVRGAEGLETVEVWVGAVTADGRLHVRTSEREQVFLVSAHLESSLVPRRALFERSDEAMKELSALRERRKRETAGHAGATGSAHAHDHPGAAPTHVPSEMMDALRALARDQRTP